MYVLRLASLLNLGRRPEAQGLREFGDLARQSKHANPILGILAAYAYDRSGNLTGLASIADYFQSFNHFVPYDVLMLGGEAAHDVPSEILNKPRPWRRAGGFPLFTRGWSLLEGLQSGAALQDVRRGMLDGPWISLDEVAGCRFAELVSQGAL